MSLFSSIQQANNALKASQIGLQVVGQNIANASTPGYTREEVILAPAPTQKVGGLLLGLGVRVKGVVQKIDNLLEGRLRTATSDRAGAEVQEQAFLTLEGLLGELSDTDLSTLLNNFFGSINEVVNQPENVGLRQLAVFEGRAVAQHINFLAKRTQAERTDLNKRIVRAVDEINRLTEEIRVLNLQIAEAEGGDISESDAVGLRDQRLIALTNLSALMDVRVAEQPDGSVAIFSGGEFLVFQTERREVISAVTSDRGLTVAEIQLADTKAPLPTAGGEVGGLIAARDTIFGGFFDRLNEFAATLAFEFNKIYSGGQGLTGFNTVTSEFQVQGSKLALNAAGLEFTPQSGALDVFVSNETTGLVQTQTILIDLESTSDATTLAELAAELDSIEGISASVTTAGKLNIQSDSADTKFAFARDTSGVLAALGINTFFSGSHAFDLGVNQVLANDPAKFAASQGGIGEDADNAIELVSFLDKPLEARQGATILGLFDTLTQETTLGSTVSQSVAEGFRIFEETLIGQRMATSGVSLDDEAVRMITLQRSYQASARYIRTLTDLLDILVNL